MKTLTFALVGVAVHCIFFYSIFDIYFTSPLVHGMQSHTATVQPPAKRLVLFVVDGLRADKFFEVGKAGESAVPYLRDILQTKGAWGVSHTRVPTESRPGHVALIAGFYEDVSAVAKGWKENPVEFDSVFNESRFTWSWGSPDILPMFAKGASGDHVFTHCYSAELEDFAGSDSTQLDTWVFEKVTKFFSDVEGNSSLQAMVHQDRVVFFLHLLGMDTTGHSHKPYSQEYQRNLRLVDSGIKEMVSLFENIFRDGQTAYLMSADHGMTNWGSHGAGHPQETLTPLLAWGAGIRNPKSVSEQIQHYEDGFSNVWKLDHLARTDVEQADIAPLMSSLIGIPFPMNSVGRLPLDYLNITDWEQADMIFTNAKQILEQYQMKMEEKKSTTLSATFRPFSDLSPGKQADSLRHIRSLIQAGKYQDAISESKHLIQLALKGLNYYQTYDRFFLGASITLGFLGWMSYVLQLVLNEHTGVVCHRMKVDKLQQPFWKTDKGIVGIFSIIGGFVFILLLVQSLSWTNHMYCLLPVVLWMCTCLSWEAFSQTLAYITSMKSKRRLVVAVLLCMAGLEILVAGFFRRELLSVGLVLMGIWPLFTGQTSLQTDVLQGWLLSCVSIAVFPMMPVVGRETYYNSVLLAGFATTLSALFSISRLKHQGLGLRQGISLSLYIQVILVILASYIVHSTSESIANKEGTPYVNQVLSWGILGVSFLLPLASGTGILERLLSVAMAFLSSYFLLSTSYEALFVLNLCCLLYFWLGVEYSLTRGTTKQLEDMDFVSMEHSLEGVQDRFLEMDDLRRAFFFVFLVLTGFFGTGNIASINSFDPASIYCFLTVFNPFVMGGLMLWKNVIPLVLVTCTFRAIHIVTRVPTRALFLLVMLMCDVMGLNFFFLVQDYGSWLDIGTSISHYVIVMTMIIFLMLLFGLSHFITTCRMFSSKIHKQ